MSRLDNYGRESFLTRECRVAEPAAVNRAILHRQDEMATHQQRRYQRGLVHIIMSTSIIITTPCSVIRA